MIRSCPAFSFFSSRARRLAGAFLVLASAAMAAPVPRTILFVDDQDVLYRPGTYKRVVTFGKETTNPVVAPERQWEGMIGWTSVYRDPATGRFQMWYQAYQQRRTEDSRLRSVVCYAESGDGVNWVKPNLGLFPFYEETDTNIVLIGSGGHSDRYCNSVFVDDRDPDPAKRYKMLYYDWSLGEGAEGGAGVRLAFSPDGIRWTKVDRVLSKTSYGGKWEQPPFSDETGYVETRSKKRVSRSWRVPQSMSDGLDFFYDERRAAYVVYGKMWLPGPDGGMAWKHGMGRITSKDLLNWTKPEVVLTTNDRDPPHIEFHTSPVFPYNGLYLSLNQTLDRDAGIIDTELMSSRDGDAWNRDFANIPVIPRGTPDRFDAGSILTNAYPVILEDKILFYYGAYRGTAVGGSGLNRQVAGSTDYFSGVGLATTPRDRFVVVRPDPDAPVKEQKKGGPKLVNTIGNVTLKALDLAGATEILVNADATGGTVRVELLTEDGYRLRGFTKDDAEPITGDGLRLAARWREKTLRDLPAGRHLIRVHLENAGLHAVTIK